MIFRHNFPSDETLLISRCFINAERHQGWMGHRHHKQKDDNSQTTCIHMLKDSWNFSRTSFKMVRLFNPITHTQTILSHCFNYFSLSISPSFSLLYRVESLNPCYSCWVICVLFLNIHLFECFILACFDCLRSGLWIFFSGLVTFWGICMFIDHITIADCKRIQRAHTSESFVNVWLIYCSTVCNFFF